MNAQTLENRPRDSRFFVGVGIDGVRKEWQNTATVPGAFAKTAAFPARYLPGLLKTVRPRPVAGPRALTTT